MHYTITQDGDRWVLAHSDIPGDSALLSEHDTYEAAVTALAGLLVEPETGADAAAASDGLLPETWTDVNGIAFSRALAGGRDFTDVAWSSRDPQASLLPLMLQTSTDMGHFGAELAGFIETIDTSTDTPRASGRFYANEQGIAARDLLLDGRKFGVSVDPSENVDATFVCTETDEEGWCMDGKTVFTAYEIAGLTMTPFPAFEEAAIQLAGAEAPNAAPVDEPVPETAAVVSVTASALDNPPAEWFTLPEPQLGEPFLGTLGDEFLVDQGDGNVACPLTITDEGQVFGNLARWGQCHVSYPGACVTPPESASAYAHFHIGEVVTADGSRVATGALTVSCEHADETLDAWAAIDHYAHSGHGWANVRASNGVHGPWVAGALRPGLTSEQIAVVRSLTLSGDWRRIGGNLELIGALAVNVPGFPVARDAVLAAGLAIPGVPMAAARVVNGEQQSLVAAGLVARCSDCQKRMLSGDPVGRVATRDDGETLTLLRTLERRTRHLIPDAARAARLRIG